MSATADNGERAVPVNRRRPGRPHPLTGPPAPRYPKQTPPCEACGLPMLAGEDRCLRCGKGRAWTT